MLWIFTVFIYVFFVYGIIEFARNIFYDFMKRKSINVNHSIRVLVNNADEVEYMINYLKRDYNHIILVLEKHDEEIEKIIKSISDDISIEYTFLSNLVEAKKS